MRLVNNWIRFSKYVSKSRHLFVSFQIEGKDKPLQDFVVICLFDAIEWNNNFDIEINIKDEYQGLSLSTIEFVWWDHNHFDWMRMMKRYEIPFLVRLFLSFAQQRKGLPTRCTNVHNLTLPVIRHCHKMRNRKWLTSYIIVVLCHMNYIVMVK